MTPKASILFVLLLLQTHLLSAERGLKSQRHAEQRILAAIPAGSEYPLHTSFNYNRDHPGIIRLKGGNIATVWCADGGQDGSGYAVYSMTFSSNQAVTGAVTRVNTYTS